MNLLLPKIFRISYFNIVPLNVYRMECHPRIYVLYVLLWLNQIKVMYCAGLAHFLAPQSFSLIFGGDRH